MKKRNNIIIVVSVAIFAASGALLYRYLAPPTQGSGIKVIVPHPVSPNFNQEQLNTLRNDVVDYSQNIAPIDASTSAGNSPSSEAQQSPQSPSQAPAEDKQE